MRKLLAILLIAVIACNGFLETFESLELDNEAIELGLFSWIGKLWNKVKGVFGKIWKVVKGPVEWLKKKGILDQLISLAKTASKSAVTSLCSEHFSESICKPVVEGVYKLV